MKLLLLLSLNLTIFTLPSFGHDFKYFEVNSEKMNKNFKNHLENDQVSNLESQKNITPLLMMTEGYLSKKYQNITNDKIFEINQVNKDFNFGSQNFSGYHWQKPFGHFDLNVNRTISPDLFDINRWIIEDTHTLTIDAQSYLEKLSGEGSIRIDPENLQAFAGMKFKRVYRYIHFSSSYKKALISDPRKLFLTFLFVNPDHMMKMNEDEIMSKEDFLTVEAFGELNLPSQYGFSVEAGGKLNLERMSSVKIQKLRPGDKNLKDESVRVSFNKEKGVQKSVKLSLTLDFINLLKITLLSSDLEYNYLENKSLNFSFSESDIEQNYNFLKDEIDSIFKFKVFDPENLVNNIVSEESRKEEGVTSTKNFFSEQRVESSSLQKIKITEEGQTHLYLQARTQKSAEKQNVFALLIEEFAKSFIELPLHYDSVIESTKQDISLEYESFSHQEDQQFVKNKNISFSLKHDYKAQLTDLETFASTKQRASNFIIRNTTLSPLILHAFQNDELKAPIRIQSKIDISNQGLSYFLNLTSAKRQHVFARICHIYTEIDWSNFDQLPNSCLKELYSSTQNLIETEELKVQSADRYEQFIKVLQSNVGHISDYNLIFNEDNIKISGSFSSQTKDNHFFHTYFSEGFSESKGVIKDQSRAVSY